MFGPVMSGKSFDLSISYLTKTGNSNIQLEHRDNFCNRTLNRRVSKGEMTSPVPVGDSWDTMPDPPESQSSGSASFSHQWGHSHTLNVKSEMKWNSLSHVWVFAPNGLDSPWNFLGQNTGVGSCSLLQGIFRIQGSNPGLLYCRQILYLLSYRGFPTITIHAYNFVYYFFTWLDFLSISTMLWESLKPSFLMTI